MAATESKSRRGALRALTAAALALPGLVTQARADGDEFSFEFRHYEEGKRDLAEQTYKDLNLRPITVDSAAASMRGEIVDRVKFNLNFTQDTWSGATPVVTVPVAAISDQLFSGASAPVAYSADAKGNPVNVNWNTFNGRTIQYTKDPRLVHVMASASPETRRQVDFGLGYDWDEMTLGLGGGFSEEHDYHSRFVNIAGTWDLDRKLTVLSWGASYTHSDIDASLAANAAADWGAYLNQIHERNGVSTLFGTRQDFSANVGATQVLNKDALLEASLGYTRSSGYLSNPYKAVVLAFDDPDQFIDSTGLRTVVLKGTLEQRPTLRNQWSLDTRYVQYIDSFDAALHADYRFYHDDWGIDAHTLDVSWYQPLGDGWMIVPGARYYSQSKASFYRPYFLFDQPFPILFPRNPELPPNLDHSQIHVKNFSSDERLSAYGTLNAQLAVSKQLSNNMRFEIGAEYFDHAGSLKLGSGGEGSFADFKAYTIYANLNIGAGAAAVAAHTSDPDAYDEYSSYKFKGSHAPAGVSFDHMLARAGDFQIAYRYTLDYRSGEMVHGSHSIGDQAVVDHGCGDRQCLVTPENIFAHAQTLDLLYAPTDWWTLVLTPELVDRHMDLRDLAGRPFFPSGIFNPGPVESHSHTTGGIGDTALTALIELFDDGENHLHAGVGISVPTGRVNERISGSEEFDNYTMQLGSGTWDFHPSLTYTGQMDRFSWGAQLSGIKRIESRNRAGYALGGEFQSTAWGSYDFLDWLSGSVRGVYTSEGGIKGEFVTHRVPSIVAYKFVGTEIVAVYENAYLPNTVLGPMESPANYGGRYWDIGFGLSAVVPDGHLQGNRFSVEWLQPVTSDITGYQLARKGTLSISWNIAM